MPRFDPVQSNFTGGEFSPRLLGNFELEKYKQGLNKLENFLVQSYGGVSRRGGFKYVATVKDSSKTTILHEFKYKDEFSYILEFGNLYIRFYRNQAQIVDGSAVEVVTTYLEAEVADLRFTQDEDTLYIVHKNHPPAKLTRTSHIAWSLDDIEFSYGTGFEWTAKDASEDNLWRDICWSPKLEIFCAIASTGTNRVMTSPDGVNWTARAASVANEWMGICWSPDLEIFCAVSRTGTGDRVMTSSDGVTWSTQTSIEDNSWASICWSPSLTLFVAVAFNGTNRVMTSPNGTAWTARSAGSTQHWYGVCWNPDDSLFVMVSSYISGTNYVGTSTDGINWTVNRDTPSNSEWRDVCWADTLGLFVAVASTGDINRVMTSPDGVTWTAREAALKWSWMAICWATELQLLVAVDYLQGKIMTSSDGVSWTAQTSPSSTDIRWQGICWSLKLYMFCAVSELYSGASSTTTDRVAISTSTTQRSWQANNYPTLCWFFEQRFFLASTPDESNEVWGSRSADYFNMNMGTGLDNEAINIKIKEAIKLLWVTTSVVIILGAHNAEFKLSANNLNEALTPTNIRPVKVTSYGGAFLPAIDVDGNAIFVQRGLRKIRRIEYELAKDKYKAVDISILGEHITESGLIDIAYINEPESLIWGVRDDGALVCLTYEPEYQVYGWSKHVVGGTDVKVKSIAVSDAIEANEDELWAVISRTINSATVQCVEFLKQGLTPEDAQVDAFFVDSGVTKTGNDFTTFDGLTHLEGETVQVFADGLIQATKVVNGSGEITITAADKAHAGLAYESILETLPIEGGNPIGSAMGKIKRISKVVLRLYKSLKFVLGDLLGNTSETVTLDTSLYTGDTEELDFHGTHETGGQIKVSVSDPVPFTLLALMYKARTEE